MEKYEIKKDGDYAKYFDYDREFAQSILHTFQTGRLGQKFYVNDLVHDHFHLIRDDGWTNMERCNFFVKELKQIKANEERKKKKIHNKLFELHGGGYVDRCWEREGVEIIYGGAPSTMMGSDESGIYLDKRDMVFDWNSVDGYLEFGVKPVGYDYCNGFLEDKDAPWGYQLYSRSEKVDLTKKEWVKFEDMVDFTMNKFSEFFDILIADKTGGEVSYIETKGGGFTFWSVEQNQAWKFVNKIYTDNGWGKIYTLTHGTVHTPPTETKAGVGKGYCRGRKNRFPLPKKADIVPISFVKEKMMNIQRPLVEWLFEADLEQKKNDYYKVEEQVEA